MTCTTYSAKRAITLVPNPYEKLRSSLKIGYQNALQSADAGFDANIVTWKPWDTGSVTASTEIALNQPQTMAYFGVINGPSGLALEYYDGAAWQQAGSASDGETVFLTTFSAIRADQWRVQFPSDAEIGVLAAGPLMHWQPQEAGFTPPELADDVSYLSNISQSGNFLGRVVTRRAAKFNIKLAATPEDYVYEFAKPLIDHTDELPFFLNWSRDEACFCWTTARPQPSYSSDLNMALTMELRGWVA